MRQKLDIQKRVGQGANTRWKHVGTPVVDPDAISKEQLPPRGGWVMDVPASLVTLGLATDCRATLGANPRPWRVLSVVPSTEGFVQVILCAMEGQTQEK